MTPQSQSPEYRSIPIGSVVEDRKFQFRVSPYDIKGLIESIQAHGQRVPVIVQERPDGRFDLLAGFHRVAALKELKQKEVSARIYSKLTDEQATQIALRDNIDRQDLTAWDFINAAAELRKSGRTNAEVGKMLKGVTARTVQRYLTVAKAPKDFQNALMAGQISIQQAYEALQKKIPLAELKRPGQSVRRLRQMASATKTKRASVIFRHTRNGGIIFKAAINPNESDLDEAIDRVNELLSELEALQAKRPL